MVFNKDLHRFQDNMYDMVMYITWFLYVAIVLGLSANAPEYLDALHSFIKIYISLFLIYRFNPFRRVKFTKLDGKISFSAGLFLLGTTAINSVLHNYWSIVKQYIPLLQ